MCIPQWSALVGSLFASPPRLSNFVILTMFPQLYEPPRSPLSAYEQSLSFFLRLGRLDLRARPSFSAARSCDYDRHLTATTGLTLMPLTYYRGGRDTVPRSRASSQYLLPLPLLDNDNREAKSRHQPIHLQACDISRVPARTLAMTNSTHVLVCRPYAHWMMTRTGIFVIKIFVVL